MFDKIKRSFHKILQHIYIWALEFNGKEEIPRSLKKNINRFYLTGTAILIASTVMMFIENSVSLNIMGLVIGVGFILSGIYLTRQYKLKKYVAFDCTCMEIRMRIIDELTEKLSLKHAKGKKRIYVVELENGVVKEIHQQYKDNRIVVGSHLRVYVKQNIMNSDKIALYGYLGIDVLPKITIP